MADIDTSLPIHAAAEVRHHFDTADQQFESSTLGMWVFLLTEVMFFGGMFGSYTVYRNLYPGCIRLHQPFHERNAGRNQYGRPDLQQPHDGAGSAAQLGSKKKLILFLLLTLALGCIFLAIKYVEYHEKWVDHHIPGPGFHYEDSRYAHEAQILFFLYFAMTGMHALHMIVGAGLLTTLIVMASRNRFNEHWFTPVEMIGLYWHFVDIVWIFLFPLLYLIGHTK